MKSFKDHFKDMAKNPSTTIRVEIQLSEFVSRERAERPFTYQEAVALWNSAKDVHAHDQLIHSAAYYICRLIVGDKSIGKLRFDKIQWVNTEPLPHRRTYSRIVFDRTSAFYNIDVHGPLELINYIDAAGLAP